MRRRFHRFLIVSVLIIGAVSPLRASAQTILVRAGEIPNLRVSPGSSLRVPISLDLTRSGAVNIAALQQRVSWDAHLRFDSIRVVGGRDLTFTANTTGAIAQRSLSFSVFRNDALDGDTASVVILHFTAGELIRGGTVRLESLAAGNDEGESVLPSLLTRSLPVCVAESGLWGDVNGDSIVNVIDAQQIARFSVGLSVLREDLVQRRGDITADATVNVIDAQQVARFAVGLPATPRAGTELADVPEVASVALTSDVPGTLTIGSRLVLESSLQDGEGSDLSGCTDVQFQSDAPDIVTVDAWGILEVVGLGQASIEAASGSTRTGTALTTLLGQTEWGQTSLAAGAAHTCGLNTLGDALCWGDNRLGQVGDGSTTTRLAPSAVSRPGPYLSIAAGEGHSCALGLDRSAWCWGWNQYGELGDGSLTRRTDPVRVSLGVPVAGIASGGFHTCALDGDGAAYCWGLNDEGQLGDGTRIDRSFPTPVAGGHTFQTIDAGRAHTCATKADGSAWCWGSNEEGRLGDGSTARRVVPTAVSGGIQFSSIVAGPFHTCGIDQDGVAWCWGWNHWGQLGDLTLTSRNVPARVYGDLTFHSITVSDRHTCAIRANGEAWCWGENWGGRLGDGTAWDQLEPVRVLGNRRFVMLSAMGGNIGAGHTCGLESTGSVACWGHGGLGQLGTGSTGFRSVPTSVVGDHVFRGVR
jgi:alpha-tubulin suppressor-like RCC1 family protein